MSRSCYSDDICWQEQALWRGAVTSAIRGKRGQAFLREMLRAFDALPERKLIDGFLESECGVCAIGAVGKARGLDMSGIDTDDHDGLACIFGIAPALAREILYQNDDSGRRPETDEERYTRMLAWIESCMWEKTA